jgi:hypothetical protein
VHTSETLGTTASLRPSGIGRYVTAAFLGLWLGGWVIGEVFAGTAMVAVLGAIAGISVERLPPVARSLLDSNEAALAILFLAVWLTFWTIGGIAASTAFLRSIAGEDSIAITPLGFELARRAGPFRRRYAFQRSAVRRIRIRPHDKALVVDSDEGTREVTSFGSPLEREEVSVWLNNHLQLPDREAAMPATPSTWDVTSDGGVTYLRKVKPRVRAIRSIVCWIMTGALATACVNSIGAETDPKPILFAITIAMGIVAVLSTWARREWIVRPGEMTFRRSLATWTSEQTFRDARLEIAHSRDSDNDSHYALNVAYGDSRRAVHSQVNDSREVVDLGHWLATRTGFPFTP